MNHLAVEPKQKITHAEMERRREAMRQAADHNRPEGQFPTPEGTAIFEANLKALHRHLFQDVYE